MTHSPIERLTTGVRNFDRLLGGGLVRGSLTVLAGPPGSGKTILAQQIAFHSAAAGLDVLYFHTLSEPTAKMLLYLQEFSYCDPSLLGTRVHVVDLGVIVRGRGLTQINELVMEHVERLRPAVVIIDSVKSFDDVAASSEDQRKFSYEFAINLMAWECTALLLGEYGSGDYDGNPLFAIADGILTLSRGLSAGEERRFLQVFKMRGAAHFREPAPFDISADGVRIFLPRLMQTPPSELPLDGRARFRTGIERLDDLLADGILAGSSLLVSGVAGTGKTAMLLEVLYRGAVAFGEKSIFFSFEETVERLRGSAKGFGWDIDAALASGLLEIVAIAPPDLRIETALELIHDRVVASGAKRIAIDSVSVFLQNMEDPREVREKVCQLTSIVQTARALGLFAVDVPYGTARLSRSGIEETLVDGVILLTSVERGLDRQRFLEIYKLRNTAHLSGRHSMTIGRGGMQIFPRYADDQKFVPPRPISIARRLSFGVPVLDRLMGGGVLERSVTLASGSSGVGKTLLALHFALAGVARGEPTLFIAREESPEQILATATALGLPLQDAMERGAVELLFLSREDVRAAQLLTILTEKVKARRVQRLVLDTATQLESDDADRSELPQLLYSMVLRLKALGVTSLFTLESKTMFADDPVGDQGLSPIVDNVVTLRYLRRGDGVEHVLGVVKSRGSRHRKGAFPFRVAAGGIRFEEDGVVGRADAAGDEGVA